MRKSIRKLVLPALLLVAIAGTKASGQDTTRASSTLTAFTLGLPGVGSETFYQLFTLGMTFNGFRPDRINPEFAVGTMPYALGYGVAAAGLRLGLAVPLVFSERVILLPSAGAGAVMVFASGAGAAPAAYAGFATVIGTGRTPAFRAGVTVHRFSDLDEPVWLLEIGSVLRFRRK